MRSEDVWDLRSKIEVQLRDQLAKTESEYRIAKAECQRLMQIHEDLGTPHPDGRVALRQAIEVQHRALAAYSRALIRFNAFVLDGKLPED